jgi:hypothetical protein
MNRIEADNIVLYTSDKGIELVEDTIREAIKKMLEDE